MNQQNSKKSKNHAEIMRINKQIEALERQRDKLFDEDSKLERETKKRLGRMKTRKPLAFARNL